MIFRRHIRLDAILPAMGFIFIAGLALAATNTADNPSRWTGIMGLLLAYVTGIGISFTPCVWPIYPITSSVIINSSSVKSRKMALVLSLVYVLGLAVVYTILGAVTGKIGQLASNYLKSVWMVLLVSLFLVIFGLSMLGLFEIKIPSSIGSRMMKGSRKGFIGVFIMGLISGLVLSPCITPVVGALIGFVIKSGSWLVGARLFFAFSLGMGTILVIIGTVSGALKALPKPGPWMVRVRQAFGVIMIGLAMWLAWPVMASALREESGSPPPPPEKKAAAVKQTNEKKEPDQIEWIKDLEKGLSLAESQNKPVMIDFTADWCKYCHVLDKETFPDPDVVSQSQKFVMIKFDATRHTPEVQRVLAKYQITGFPSLLFKDRKGDFHMIPGFVGPDVLLKAMVKVEAIGRESTPSPTPKPPSPGGGETAEKTESREIQWIKNFDEGMEMAKSQGKPVLIDFTAEWCTYCKVMDKKTFPDKRVVEESQRFVMIKFDATRPTKKVREITRRYQIRGYPTQVSIDTKGNVDQLVGYVKPDRLVEYMEQIH